MEKGRPYLQDPYQGCHAQRALMSIFYLNEAQPPVRSCSLPYETCMTPLDTIASTPFPGTRVNREYPIDLSSERMPDAQNAMVPMWLNNPSSSVAGEIGRAHV